MTERARIVSALRQQERPLRFILGKGLMALGVSHRLVIRRHGVRLRFHPSAVPLTYFADPRSRASDETVLTRLLPNGGTFLDVGANVGSLALVAARVVGPSGTVIALEPHPRSFEYLRENVSLNSFSNVECVLAAAGEGWDLTGLSDERQDDTNRLVSAAGSFRVPVVPLDALRGIDRVDLLKIDVEGGEVAVLRGASEVLTKTRAVYFEASLQNYAAFGSRPEEAILLLEEAGFVVHQLQPRGWARVGSDVSLAQHDNLLALRSSELSGLRSRLGDG